MPILAPKIKAEKGSKRPLPSLDFYKPFFLNQ